tara:strand:- start:1849 stop:2199 length:351 start_codon:yes stop_codon:yes gene_type:complete
MVKLESLKKDNQFKLVLSGKKIHNNFFSVFAKKNSKDNKNKNVLRISFVMKKREIGNAVKRNKIRRKLKAIVIKLVKIKGAINRDYTYIVFGKSNAFTEKNNVLMPAMIKCFNKIK